MMLRYPIHCEPDDNGTLLVTCPVLPEVTTFAESKVDAWQRGREAVEEAIGARIAQWQEVPVSTRADLDPAFVGDQGLTPASFTTIVGLSTLADLKTQLFLACWHDSISRADLMRRLGWHREQVDRLFRFDHSTQLSQFDAAFNALGKEVVVSVADAEAPVA